jgi:hypothetical protein
MAAQQRRTCESAFVQHGALALVCVTVSLTIKTLFLSNALL